MQFARHAGPAERSRKAGNSTESGRLDLGTTVCRRRSGARAV